MGSGECSGPFSTSCFLSSGAELEHLRSVMMQIKVSSPSAGDRGEALWDPVRLWATIKNRAMVSGGPSSPGNPGRCTGERDGQRYDKRTCHDKPACLEMGAGRNITRRVGGTVFWRSRHARPDSFCSVTFKKSWKVLDKKERNG